MQAVDPLHDSLRPLNARFDNSVCDGRAVRHAEKVIRPLHVHGAQDRRHHSDYPFASFVHLAQILRFRLFFVHTVVILGNRADANFIPANAALAETARLQSS